MATRAEQIQRKKMADEAREQLKSGNVRQSAINPRTEAVRNYTPPVDSKPLPKVEPETFGTPMKELQQKYDIPRPEQMVDSFIQQGQLQSASQSQNQNNITQYDVNKEAIDKLSPYNPVKYFSQLMNGLTYGNPIGKFVSRAGSMPDTILSGGNPVTIRPDLGPTANKTADILGMGLTMAVPSGAPIGAGPIAAPYNAVDNVIAASPKLQKIESSAANLMTAGGKIKPQTAQAVTREVMREGTAGALQGPALTMMSGQPTNEELVESAALGTLGGAVLGGALPLIAQPIKSAMNNRKVGNALMDGIRNTELSVNPYSSNITKTVDSPMTKVDDINPSVVSERPQVERGFTSTLKSSEKSPVEFTERLNSNYTPITNAETVQKSNLRISNNVDEATNYVLGPSRFDAEKSVTAQRLIDHYNQQGNYQMAVSIADKVASEATKAGQAIQALSIYEKLTPEGILIHAKQIANKVNENIPKFAKESVITDQMAADLTDLAATTQKMTGVKNLSNDVMDILERAKSGEKLTSLETDQLQRFVNESKQFIKESTKPQKPPKAPRQPKDKRVRQAVTTFLDAQEQAAKERLRARGIQISSTPLDIWADYAIVGAAKMGKGIVKFSEWSEVMIKDLGEEIRPMLNQLYERARETFETSTKRVSKQTVSNAERLTDKIIKTKELTPDEADQLMGLAQRVSNLSGEEKRLASQDLQAILQELDRPTTLKKISTAQTMGQLLNPKTHVRNVLGNELFYRVERLNKLLSTPIDITRSKLTGGPRYVTFKTNNQGQFWKNWMEGTKAGWRGVNINGLQTQFDLSGQAFKSKYNPMTYLEKTLGAALRGFDNAAYMRAYNNTLGELGTLDAINKGIKSSPEYVQQFIAKADENIMQLADDYGRYVTFQDNNLFSKGLSNLKRGMNKVTGSVDFGIGDLVLKYPKTPGALLMRALEYSPAGFLRSLRMITRPIYKKGIEFAPGEIAQAVSRATIGTLGFSGLGYFLLDKGILTGDASRDKDIRSLEQAAGKGAYQINLSALQRFVQSGFDPDEATIKENDLLYTYDWAQPVSMAISMGANMRKSQDEGKETALGVGVNILNNVASGVNTLTNQSVLQGLAKAAEGYPGQTVSDKIIDIISEIPSSFTPTMFNQIKQLTDNTRRETYSPNKWEQSLNKSQARIPGLAQRLPAQYDTLGNEKQTYQDNNLFNVLLNPGFSSRYKLSPEAKLIVDLITETGDESLAPRVPGKTVDGNKLTGEQFSRYSQLQGEETKKRLEKINPNAKTSTQVKKVQKALTKSSEQAKKKLKKEFDLQKVDKK